MTRAIVAIFGLGVVVVMMLAGVQAGLQNAGYEQTVVNETFQNPTAGTVITLDESNRNGAYYDRNVTVYDENGTEMAHGTDYDWTRDNGTLEPLAGGALAGDANGTITYAYQQTTAEQRRMAGLLAQLPRAVGLFLPVLAFVLFLILARGG